MFGSKCLSEDREWEEKRKRGVLEIEVLLGSWEVKVSLCLPTYY